MQATKKKAISTAKSVIITKETHAKLTRLAIANHRTIGGQIAHMVETADDPSLSRCDVRARTGGIVGRGGAE